MTFSTTLEIKFEEAVKAENTHAVQQLLELADINICTIRDSLKYLRTSVPLAAYLLQMGADIKTPDLLKDTLLECTVPLMAFFLEKGCQLTMKRCKDRNESLIGFLLYHGDHPEKLKLLLRYDAPFPTIDSESKQVKGTPLYHALTLDRPKSLDIIFDSNTNVVHDIGLSVFLEISHTNSWMSGMFDEERALRRMLLAGVRFPKRVRDDLTVLEKRGLCSQQDCDAYRDLVMRWMADETHLRNQIAQRRETEQVEQLAEKKRIAEFERKVAEKVEKQKQEYRARVAQEIQLEIEKEREAAAAKTKQMYVDREAKDETERRQQQKTSERLRIAEGQEIQRLAEEHDRDQRHHAFMHDIESRRQNEVNEHTRLAEEENAIQQDWLAMQQEASDRRSLRETFKGLVNAANLSDLDDMIRVAEYKPEFVLDNIQYLEEQDIKESTRYREQQKERKALEEEERRSHEQIRERLRIAEIEEVRQVAAEHDWRADQQRVDAPRSERIATILAKLTEDVSGNTENSDNHGIVWLLEAFTCNGATEMQECARTLVQKLDKSERLQLLRPLVDHMIKQFRGVHDPK